MSVYEQFREWLPAEFLPRLQPLAFGTQPRSPFAQRWFGRAAGLDVVVLSRRPVGGVSEHLVSDRSGHWIAYTHAVPSGRRLLIGGSERGRARLAAAFGLPIVHRM